MNPEACYIREATIADFAFILQAEQVCFPLDSWQEEAIASQLTSAIGRSFVAECDGVVAGYISMYVIIDEKEIVNVCTDPEYRGLGIGSNLVCAAIEYEKEKCNTVMLEVRRSNSVAIALYEKFGFISVGVSKNHYSSPREDAILMNLEINKTEK